MIYKIGTYEISDWIYYDSDWLTRNSDIVWYRNVKECNTFHKAAIRIYSGDANSIHTEGITMYIYTLSLRQVYESIFNMDDVTNFDTIEVAKNHVDLFFDKFQKLKMFL